MASFYPYLIASLPMLHFDLRPPFSFEQFLLKCEEFIPQKDFEILKKIPLQDTHRSLNETISKYRDFDTMLRNELVKLRAARKKISPDKYLRPGGYAGTALYHIAHAAQRSPSPLEGERMLDSERWNFLEELAQGHYFDLDTLIIYANKLLILKRWERINQADKSRMLEEALSKH
ncbi:MAG: DUF2764 family protein [Candidatus Omnitrophica bacterium]|nr:DUF2764 family protein [Candidatus Omnitrophota bacterium]